MRLLSATPEPTTMTSFTTAGGDVSSYSSSSDGGLRSPRRRFTEPPAPNCGQGVPVAASSAKRRASTVATMMRRRQAAPFAARASTQVETPRLFQSPKLWARLSFASNTQRCAPVSGSSAMTRPSGVLKNSVPSTTIGVASKEVGRPGSGPCEASPVL